MLVVLMDSLQNYRILSAHSNIYVWVWWVSRSPGIDWYEF